MDLFCEGPLLSTVFLRLAATFVEKNPLRRSSNNGQPLAVLEVWERARKPISSGRLRKRMLT